MSEIAPVTGKPSDSVSFIQQDFSRPSTSLSRDTHVLEAGKEFVLGNSLAEVLPQHAPSLFDPCSSNAAKLIQFFNQHPPSRELLESPSYLNGIGYLLACPGVSSIDKRTCVRGLLGIEPGFFQNSIALDFLWVGLSSLTRLAEPNHGPAPLDSFFRRRDADTQVSLAECFGFTRAVNRDGSEVFTHQSGANTVQFGSTLTQIWAGNNPVFVRREQFANSTGTFILPEAGERKARVLAAGDTALQDINYDLLARFFRERNGADDNAFNECSDACRSLYRAGLVFRAYENAFSSWLLNLNPEKYLAKRESACISVSEQLSERFSPGFAPFVKSITSLCENGAGMEKLPTFAIISKDSPSATPLMTIQMSSQLLDVVNAITAGHSACELRGWEEFSEFLQVGSMFGRRFALI